MLGRMTYVRNPVFLGVGVIDQEDRDSVLVREAKGKIAFKNAIRTLMTLPPEKVEAFKRELLWAVSTLPQSQRRQVETLANAFTKSDQRVVPGLGQAAAAAAAGQAVHWSTTVANIAGVVASLATVGFGVANFIEQRKAQKSADEQQSRQQAMAEQALQADLAAKKQQLEQSKAAFDADQQQKQLEASGYMMTADGQIVPKPKSSAATIGAIAAAVAGGFFLTR